MSFRFSQ